MTHEQARQLLMQAKVEGAELSSAARTHISECTECSEYAAGLENMTGAIRRAPVQAAILAPRPLVAQTQFLMLMRARQMNAREARLWPVWVSCILVSLVAGLSTFVLHDFVHDISSNLGVSSIAADGMLVSLWFWPAALVATFLLWLRPEPALRTAH